MYKIIMKIAGWLYNCIPSHIQEQFKISGLNIRIMSKEEWEAYKMKLSMEAYNRKRQWIIENLDEKTQKKNGIKILDENITIDTTVCSWDLIQKINNA